MKRALCTAVAAMGLTIAAAVVQMPGTAAADTPTSTFGPGSQIILRPAGMRYAASGQCTLGAVEHRPDGTTVGITAGHCGDVGSTVLDPANESHVIGAVVANVGGVDLMKDIALPDYDLISFARSAVDNSAYVWSPIKATDWIFSNGRYFPSLGMMSAADLQQSQPILCKYGAKTGQSCGTIASIDAKHNAATVDMASGPGDSGAPVYAMTQAGAYLVGIVTSVPNYGGGPTSDIKLIQDQATKWGLNLVSQNPA